MFWSMCKYTKSVKQVIIPLTESDAIGLGHTVVIGARRVDGGNDRYCGVYRWGQSRVMGQL